jgi:hypothetical protein
MADKAYSVAPTQAGRMGCISIRRTIGPAYRILITTIKERAMPQHTEPQYTVNPVTSPLSKSINSFSPDDEHIRMLRFYLKSNRWVEEQISSELEIELANELQDLRKKNADWSW